MACRRKLAFIPGKTGFFKIIFLFGGLPKPWRLVPVAWAATPAGRDTLPGSAPKTETKAPGR
jgi:hypothetical protein